MLLPLAAALAAEVSGPQAAREVGAIADLLEAAHPALHRYEPQEAWAARRDAITAGLGAAARVPELTLGLALHRLLAPVGDAHLAVGLPLYREPAVTLLPVLPRSVEGGVGFEALPEGVPAGARLIAVDGEPIEGLLSELAALVMVDGRDPAAARREVEADLPRFHALARGLAPRHALTIEVGGARRDVEVAGVDKLGLAVLRAARRVAWSGRATAGGLPELERLPDGLAVLRAPTFGVADMERFAAAAAAALADVAPDEPLLIDLRGNQGGLRPNAQAIADRLTGPAAEWAGMFAVTRRTPRASLGALSWPWGSPDERLRRAPFVRREGGWWFEGDPAATRPATALPRHTGPVALLVDARTGSAANGFVQSVTLARPDVGVVGESLGGACDLHIAELPAVWVAPWSGVGVTFGLLALSHLHDAGCEPGRGAPPDVWVRPTWAELETGADPWVDAARRWLARASPG